MTRWTDTAGQAGEALIARASARYRAADPFAVHFARFKLRNDPVFAIALAQGLIPDGARILDIGCGQGLLASWLLAARQCHADNWPPGWPPPPVPRSYLGIELTPADAERARAALAGPGPWPADIRQADARAAVAEVAAACDLVVLLDVLHYIDRPAQEALLRDALRCLAPRGRLLMRVGDASAGWRARYSRAVDRVVQWLRAGRTSPLTCRPADEWRALLRGMGMTLREVPLPRDAHGANVLMVGTLDSEPVHNAGTPAATSASAQRRGTVTAAGELEPL
ncbi:class I SAM-dependent methyltransferase [Cupriavidus gilardii]|uniref:class I SAM-dependent methyltransferase n=1 Tax=Cupriavidus gilardii TaxID=82541 RepID=UPI001572C2BA|nr:class I SAM-dependent methyltransferase [Cupriavidus gilardii]NSX02851.1 class I SAM-dependent methyltransferase [Cupriavidus gilardii]